MSTDSTAPKGPASYFPSIEKKYGRPISEWVEMIRGRPHPEVTPYEVSSDDGRSLIAV